MAPNVIDHPRTRLLISLLLVVTMFSPALKVFNSLKGGLIFNPAYTASSNGMKIATIGKDSAPVSIMDIAPANALILRKAASFEHLVWGVHTLNWLYTFSKLIQFMSKKLPVDTSSALQES